MPFESKYPITLDDISQRQAEIALAADEKLDVYIIPDTQITDFVTSHVVEDIRDSIDVWSDSPFFLEKKNPADSRIYFTDSDHLSVISESGASFCSLMLLFDEDGKAFVIHDAYSATYTTGGDSIISDYPQLTEFHDLHTKLGKNKKLFLTATNIHPRLRNRLIEEVRGLFGAEFQIIDIAASFEAADSTMIQDGSIPNTSDNSISGLYFIPAKLSVNGKNQIILYGHRISKK